MVHFSSTSHFKLAKSSFFSKFWCIDTCCVFSVRFKNDGLWYLILSLNFSVFIFFSSFAILFQKSPYNLDEDFLAFFLFCLGVANNVDSDSCSGTSLGVGISSKFFIENILILKPLRTFSLGPISNLTLFRKYFLNRFYFSTHTP